MQMNALLGRLAEWGGRLATLITWRNTTWPFERNYKEVNFAICNGLKFQETLRGNGSVFLNILTFTRHVCI
jgi:hypothetical protein